MCTPHGLVVDVRRIHCIHCIGFSPSSRYFLAEGFPLCEHPEMASDDYLLEPGAMGQDTYASLQVFGKSDGKSAHLLQLCCGDCQFDSTCDKMGIVQEDICTLELEKESYNITRDIAGDIGSSIKPGSLFDVKGSYLQRRSIFMRWGARLTLTGVVTHMLCAPFNNLRWQDPNHLHGTPVWDSFDEVDVRRRPSAHLADHQPGYVGMRVQFCGMTFHPVRFDEELRNGAYGGILNLL